MSQSFVMEQVIISKTSHPSLCASEAVDWLELFMAQSEPLSIYFSFKEPEESEEQLAYS